jgi:gamma-glutamylcysteine synthetase
MALYNNYKYTESNLKGLSHSSTIFSLLFQIQKERENKIKEKENAISIKPKISKSHVLLRDGGATELIQMTSYKPPFRHQTPLHASSK